MSKRYDLKPKLLSHPLSVGINYPQMYSTSVLPKNIKERRYSVQRPKTYQLIQARALGLLSLVSRLHTCSQLLAAQVCISLLPNKEKQHTVTALWTKGRRKGL